MRMNIDPDSRVPVYLQIANNIRRSIALGSIQHGEQIPSVREIADTYNVNPNTVSRAFGVLKTDGIIETKVGVGTFLINNNTSIREQECRNIITDILDQAIFEAQLFNLDRHHVRSLFDDRLSRQYDGSPTGTI